MALAIPPEPSPYSSSKSNAGKAFSNFANEFSVRPVVSPITATNSAPP